VARADARIVIGRDGVGARGIAVGHGSDLHAGQRRQHTRMPCAHRSRPDDAHARCTHGRTLPAERAGRTAGRWRYWIWSYSENIGMYIAMTMKPTIAPTTMIMIGSMIAVSALTAAAT
jgi:hypothetical protein